MQAKEENQHILSSKEIFKPQTVKLSTAFRKASSDYPQRNARKTAGVKRKLMDPPFSSDNPSKVSCMKQRKNSQNDVKIAKVNKTQDISACIATSNSQAVHPQLDKELPSVGVDGEFSCTFFEHFF